MTSLGLDALFLYCLDTPLGRAYPNAIIPSLLLFAHSLPGYPNKVVSKLISHASVDFCEGQFCIRYTGTSLVTVYIVIPLWKAIGSKGFKRHKE